MVSVVLAVNSIVFDAVAAAASDKSKPSLISLGSLTAGLHRANRKGDCAASDPPASEVSDLAARALLVGTIRPRRRRQTDPASIRRVARVFIMAVSLKFRISLNPKFGFTVNHQSAENQARSSTPELGTEDKINREAGPEQELTEAKPPVR
jgi:hypothetical protein